MTATVSGIHLSGTHAARPGAAGPPAGSLYSCTTDSLIYRTDGTSWSTWATLTGTGIAATLADAAGDMLVASGADAWAKLTMGAAGGAVSRVNGAVAWNSGTAFPTAATGDRYWRTDLGEEFHYDGTRWVSVTKHRILIATPLTITVATTVGRVPVGQWADTWVEAIEFGYNVGGTNSGAAYWTLRVRGMASNLSATTIADRVTSGDTVSTAYNVSVSIGATLSSLGTFMYIDAQGLITAGSPTGVSMSALMVCRRIAT